METLATKKVSIVLFPRNQIMEIKDRIKQKAHEMVMMYGIRSVSMDDIANALGMSKKTIYQYYADKDELVDAVVEDELSKTQQDCEACKINAKDAVEEVVLTMNQIHDQFQNMNPVILYDMQKFHPPAFQKFLKHKHEYLYKVIRQNIERGVKEELYRPDLNIDVLSKFRLESMLIAFNLHVFPPGKYRLVEVTEIIMENFVFGLATVKGHKLFVKYRNELTKKIIPA
jgi:TetR/AcrR family transcriptional regulator, cholesterol catabolism regulator